MSREVEFMGVVKRLYLKDKYGNWIYGIYGEYVNEDYCCHCNEEIKGIKKLKVWNGKLLPMCYSCWSKWINGGR